MGRITKISEISLTKLNNAEFTYFSGQIISFVNQGTPEGLHVDEAVFGPYIVNHQKLVDLVDKSRRADETAKIAETDAQEDALLSYFFATVKTARNHPNAAKREAAQSLYNVIGVYQGVQTLPQRQQVQTVVGMVADLERDAVAAHVATLGLTAEVAELKTINTTYADLLASRADTQLANAVEAAKPIRDEMCEQYDDLVYKTWAYSVAMPTETLNNFVASVNKLIADTKAAYNQRIGQRKKEEEEEI